MSGARLLPIERGRGRVPAAGSARAWLAPRSNGTRLHAGVDLGRANLVVSSPEDARVELVGDASYADETPRMSSPRGFAGYGPGFIVLRGDSGYYHLLAHVDRPEVHEGQRVVAGAPLARISQLSRHVHWEVRRRTRPPAGAATVEIVDDPLRWLVFIAHPWTHDVDGCPERPDGSTRTPRACRPGASPELAREILSPDVVPPPGAPPDPHRARSLARAVERRGAASGGFWAQLRSWFSRRVAAEG